MRFRDPVFRIYLFIWVVVLLLSGVILFQGFRDFGVDYFLTFEFYKNLTYMVCLTLLFIALIKGIRWLIIVSFAVLITVETIDGVLCLKAAIDYLQWNMFNYLDTQGKLFYVVQGFVYPISIISYTLTYLVCMILYFMRKRIRHNLIPILSGLGVIVLLAYLGVVVTDIFYEEPRPDLISIFLDLAFAVFFHIIYVTLPRMMHGTNL